MLFAVLGVPAVALLRHQEPTHLVLPTYMLVFYWPGTFMYLLLPVAEHSTLLACLQASLGYEGSKAGAKSPSGEPWILVLVLSFPSQCYLSHMWAALTGVAFLDQ